MQPPSRPGPATEDLEVPLRPAPVSAEIAVPGSKSIANRVLVCAALADGVSTITNVPDGDDTVAMVAGLRALGLDVDSSTDRVTVPGGRIDRPAHERTISAGLAGTTSRFKTAVSALGSSPVTIDGDPPLRARPFGPLHEALTQLGVAVAAVDGVGRLPATVSGPPRNGRAEVRGDVSSQYVSALMMIGPYLPGGLELSLSTPLVSRPYVELTAATMAWFGIHDVEISDSSIRVGRGRYEATEVSVEPDASSASYPLAIAAVCGGEVTVPGLGTGALQGDARFADLLAQMGCTVDRTQGSVLVGSVGPLHGIDVDMADVSDLVPTLAVVAAFATTPTTIRGVGFIRAKESDRLGDLTAELRRAGVQVSATDDGLAIDPSADRCHGARLATHHDHRLAMAFGVLGARVGGIEIEQPDVVSKSWPGFWEAMDTAFGRVR